MHIIDETLDVDLHGWTPVRDCGMRFVSIHHPHMPRPRNPIRASPQCHAYPAQVNVTPLRIPVGVARHPMKAGLAESEQVYRLPRSVSSKHNRQLTESHLTSAAPNAFQSTMCLSEPTCRLHPTLHIPYPIPQCLAKTWYARHPPCIHALPPCVAMRFSGSPHNPWHSTCTLKKKTHSHRALPST